MNKTQLHKFINHRYRKLTVGVASIAILLVGGLPLTEDLRNSKRIRSESQEAIQSISLQADRIPALRQEAVDRLELAANQSGINHAKLPEFRDACLQLVRKHQCRVEVVSEGRPLRQPWNENMQPWVASTTVVKEKPKYEVITNSLNFNIVGELRHLVSLIEDLQRLDDFFVPTKVVVEQHNLGNELRLEVEMAMIELVKSTPAK